MNIDKGGDDQPAQDQSSNQNEDSTTASQGSEDGGVKGLTHQQEVNALWKTEHIVQKLVRSIIKKAKFLQQLQPQIYQDFLKQPDS